MTKMDKGTRGSSNVVTGDGVEAVPVLHSIMQRVHAPSEQEDLPSTVDMDALKQEPVLSAALESPLLAWRGAPGPRLKARTAEATIIRKEQLTNGIDGTSHSEESRGTEVSSSESEDSDSDSGSSSSSNSDSTCSDSASSNSSDSESDSQSTRSSSSVAAKGGQVPDSHHHQPKNSRSSSSTSSKSRRRSKHTFVTQNYEPGSLKLKIAALKIPNRQDQVSKTTTSNEPIVVPPPDQFDATKKSSSSSSSTSSNNNNSSEKKCDFQVSPRTDLKSTNSNKLQHKAPSIKEESNVTASSTTNTTSSSSRNELRRSTRTRGRPSAEPEKKINQVVTPARRPSRVDARSATPVPPPVQREPPPKPPTPKTPVEIPHQKAASEISTGESQPKVNGEVTLNGIKIHNSNFPFKDFTHSNPAVSDSVLRLANNSDLTIFPVNSPHLNHLHHHHHQQQQQQPAVAIKTLSNRHDLTITAATHPVVALVPLPMSTSPLRSSRRLSAQRKSADGKSDEYDSWDGAEAAVQAAIHTMDADDKSRKLNHGVSQQQQQQQSPMSPNKTPVYKSHLLHQFKVAMAGETPHPTVGELSIQPITYTDAAPTDSTPKRVVPTESQKLDRRSEWNSRSAVPMNSGTTTISVIKTEEGGTPKVAQMKLSKSTVKKLNGALELDYNNTSMPTNGVPPITTSNGESSSSSSPPTTDPNSKKKKKQQKQNKLSIFAPQIDRTDRAKLRSSSSSSGSSESSKKPVKPPEFTPRTPEMSGKLEPKTAKKSTPKTPSVVVEVETIRKHIPVTPRESLGKDSNTARLKSSRRSEKLEDPPPPLPPLITSAVNGVKPSNNTPTAPFQTKAAKKYIPEGNPLVIPRIGKGISKKENKKKKSKKSRSKQKQLKLLKSEHMKALEGLCDLVRTQCALSRAQLKRKKNDHDFPPGFIFSKVIYEVKPNRLMPFDQIPPPPQEVLLRAKAGTPAGGITDSTSTKKRKQFSKDRDVQDSGSDVSISSESTGGGSDLQRLPLKKRHNHNNSSTPEKQRSFKLQLTPSPRSGTPAFGQLQKPATRILAVPRLGNDSILERSKVSRSFRDIIRDSEARKSSPISTKEAKRRSGRTRKSTSSVSDTSPPNQEIVPPPPSLSHNKLKKELGSVLVVNEVIPSSPETGSNKRKNSRRMASSSGSESPLSPRKKVKSEVHVEPMEILEIIDVVKDEDAVPLSAHETLTVSTTPSAPKTPHPVITPSTIPAPSSSSVKKRRKINKTGFPSSKKKKRHSSSAKLTEGFPTPQSSGVEESGNESAVTLDDTATEGTTEDEEVSKLNMTETDEIEIIDLESAEMQDGSVGGAMNGTTNSAGPDQLNGNDLNSEENMNMMLDADHEKFSASLTERVKIRRRKSVDSLMTLVENGDVTIPGLCLSLLTLPDPPVIMPQKTNYLKAGMLANFHKRNSLDDPIVPQRNKPPPLGSVSPRLITEKSTPMYSRSRLLPFSEYPLKMQSLQKDYILPYDIWCWGVINTRNLFEHWKDKRKEEIAAAAAARKSERRRKSESTKRVRKSVLPENAPPSWKFKKIRQNLYYGGKPPYDMDSEQMCSCPDGEVKCAGDDCLNRLVFTECPVGCGENCRNRRIQRHETASESVKRFMTENKGWGVKVVEPIRKGEFILEYVGEVVPDAIFKERMHTIYAEDTHHYCLQLDGGMVIDGHRVGGECRFVNHSCEPNCEMQKWSVNGLSRMALFALRDIDVGEELSYDYNFSLYNPSEGQPCYCGSENCRGVIGGRSKSKNVDVNGTAKRKPGTKLHGLIDIHVAIQDPTILEKMKPISRRDRVYIQSHNIFLVRNYEKIRLRQSDPESRIADRLEKIMTPWVSRFKVGSSKNKPLILQDEEPRLVEMAKTAQEFHELLANLTSTKEGNLALCEPFMQLPTRRKCPQLYSLFMKGQEALDLTIIGKKILRGEYTSISHLETDIGTVLRSFSQALESERPNIMETVEKIKKIYVRAKAKAVAALEPFIVSGSMGSGSSPPKFQKVEQAGEEVIRCICGTYSEEGFMIQCERCLVWQHGDCVGVTPDENLDSHSDRKRQKKGGGSRYSSRSKSKSVSPMKTFHATPRRADKMETPAEVRGEVELGDDLISVNEELMVMDEDRKSDRLAAEECINDMATQKIEFDDEEKLECLSVTSEGNSKDIFVQEDIPVPNVSRRRMKTPDGSRLNISISQSYYCERCDPRHFDPEVPVNYPTVTPDRKYYLTLVREDGFVMRKNDTVYVLRDNPDSDPEQPDVEKGKGQRKEVTYKTAGPLVPTNCDIFRIEDLWKEKDGTRYVFGHHYLRPNETFHEPNRKFYPNEIVRSPLTEIIPVSSIHGQCWVMDPATFCKGRPVGAIEEHVYICDFRVDKKARSFSKVKKGAQSFCMKPFAFQFFQSPLKIQRNVHPHGPPSPDFKAKPFVTAGGSSSQEKGRLRKTDDKAKGRTKSALSSEQNRKARTMKLFWLLEKLHLHVPNFKQDVIPEPDILLKGRKKGKSFGLKS